mmetsp:Transcript_32786/g.84671  ORF Transcript_32786/g.84671 Transcript_32786/m.84671 type:complete len:520 (-) Transcript_32786:242-1801(-)
MDEMEMTRLESPPLRSSPSRSSTTAHMQGGEDVIIAGEGTTNSSRSINQSQSEGGREREKRKGKEDEGDSKEEKRRQNKEEEEGDRKGQSAPASPSFRTPRLRDSKVIDASQGGVGSEENAKMEKRGKGYISIMLAVIILAVVGALVGVTTFLLLSAGRDPNFDTPITATFPLSHLRLVVNTSLDDTFTSIPLPSPISLFGEEYDTAYVGSNSYITFEEGSRRALFLDTTNPRGPKVMIAAGDNSVQRLYYTRRVNGIGIRFEGTSSTSGIVGSPNLVWECVVLTSGEIHIKVETNQAGRGVSGVSNGYSMVHPFSPSPGLMLSYTQEDLNVVGQEGQQQQQVSSRIGVPPSPAYPSLSQPNITRLYLGDADNTYFDVDLPFPFRMGGENYTKVYVSSNSYLTFAAGSAAHTNLSAVYPAGPKVFIQACDNSVQILTRLETPGTLSLLFEGTGGTRGTPHFPPSFTWEVVFFSSGEMSITIGAMTRKNCLVGISNGQTMTHTFVTARGTTSYFSADELQ